MDVATEAAVDVEVLDNLTDWQLAAIAAGVGASGQDCLIQSWWDSPYSGKSFHCSFTH